PRARRGPQLGLGPAARLTPARVAADGAPPASPSIELWKSLRFVAPSIGSRPAASSRMNEARGRLRDMDLERDPFAPTPPPGQDQLPFDDGEPMETGRHRVQMNVLIDTLAAAWAD